MVECYKLIIIFKTVHQYLFKGMIETYTTVWNEYWIQVNETLNSSYYLNTKNIWVSQSLIFFNLKKFKAY